MKSFTFLLVLTIFLTPVASKALPTNFGGQIVGIFPCTCSGNMILYVRDVRFQILTLIYQPGGTILYKMYQPRPVVNSLGNYTPGLGTCWFYSGDSCKFVPTLGMILRLGTSLSI